MADLPIQAETASENPDRRTLRVVAEAWIDRWRALGGSFGWAFNADKTERTLIRGIPMSYVWEPPTFAEAEAASPALRPHEWITSREDFDGAHKMLESFLTLVPGLSDEVNEIAAALVEAGRGHADPALIGRFLECRRTAQDQAEANAS